MLEDQGVDYGSSRNDSRDFTCVKFQVNPVIIHWVKQAGLLLWTNWKSNCDGGRERTELLPMCDEVYSSADSLQWG